jgi:hypothetical protein
VSTRLCSAKKPAEIPAGNGLGNETWASLRRKRRRGLASVCLGAPMARFLPRRPRPRLPGAGHPRRDRPALDAAVARTGEARRGDAGSPVSLEWSPSISAGARSAHRSGGRIRWRSPLTAAGFGWLGSRPTGPPSCRSNEFRERRDDAYRMQPTPYLGGGNSTICSSIGSSSRRMPWPAGSMTSSLSGRSPTTFPTRLNWVKR